MNELTYILGAGASYQSIPVVNNFNSRLFEFGEYLRLRGQNDFSGDDRNKFIEASNAIKDLFSLFESHQSFDTYFKKLFHLKQFDSINQGKRLLHLYFIWEHSRSSIHSKRVKPQNEEFIKQALVDKRYDGLIAGLLEPVNENILTVCKVNFISWNYDMNLISSIKNFFYPEITYGDFLSSISKNEFYWDIDGRIKIINVNGFFYSSDFNLSRNLFNQDTDLILHNKVLDRYYISTDHDLDADNLRFSWELNSNKRNELVSLLQNVVSSSKNIVVIGYTFPLYNRIIDAQYLNKNVFAEIVQKRKNLIIQNPKANDLVEIIEDMTSNLYKFDHMKMVKESCDSFYVPSNIFI